MKSKYSGKCAKCTNKWEVDTEIFISKVSEKWIACTDKECYLSQGGKIADPNKPKFTPNKFPISEAVTIYELSETILESFKKKRKIEFDLQEEMVFIESFFRTLSGNFKA